MQTTEQPEERLQMDIRLTPELRDEINARARETGLGMNRIIVQLLRSGLDAERSKKQQLETKLRQYRECQDPQEAQRLGDEFGAMIFRK